MATAPDQLSHLERTAFLIQFLEVIKVQTSHPCTKKITRQQLLFYGITEKIVNMVKVMYDGSECSVIDGSARRQ